MTRARDLQTLRGFGELRMRYVGAGLRIGCLAYGVRAIEPGAPSTTRAIRVAMVLLCLAGLRWLPRSKDEGLALTRAMLALATLVLLVVAWSDAPRGFPFGLLLLPGVALATTLFGGALSGEHGDGMVRGPLAPLRSLSSRSTRRAAGPRCSPRTSPTSARCSS